MDNHVHLLLISGTTGLPAFMRRLLTGYAVGFNRRHRRFGHLFQNRYKSIVGELDPYLLELVRYIHLNPLRKKAGSPARMIRERCREAGVSEQELQSGSRRRAVSDLRRAVAAASPDGGPVLLVLDEVIGDVISE